VAENLPGAAINYKPAHIGPYLRSLIALYFRFRRDARVRLVDFDAPFFGNDYGILVYIRHFKNHCLSENSRHRERKTTILQAFFVAVPTEIVGVPTETVGSFLGFLRL
jgi:hypothetical protein